MIEWVLFSNALTLLGKYNDLLKAQEPDWCSDPQGDDDESYPPHLNEELESDQSDDDN